MSNTSVTPAIDHLKKSLSTYRQNNVKVTTTFSKEMYLALLEYVQRNPHLSKEQDAIRLFVASVLKKEGLLTSQF